MTELEIFQALIDGHTIEEVIDNDDENTYYRLDATGLITQNCRRVGWSPCTIDYLFVCFQDFKYRILEPKKK